MLTSNTLPPISEEFLKALEAAFPQPALHDLDPNMDRDELYIYVGQARVLNYIRRKAGKGTTVNGRPV